MSVLSYHEKLFLLMYKRVFGVQFDCADEKIDNSFSVQKYKRSLNSQFLCYFFMCNYVPIGEFGFTWLDTAPYSGNCNSFIHDLDNGHKVVSDFYKNVNEDEEWLSLLSSENQVYFVQKLCDALKTMSTHDVYSLEFAICLLYLARNVLPYYDYEAVYNELIRRNKKFDGSEYKKLGKTFWNVFLDLNLIPSIDKVYFR